MPDRIAVTCMACHSCDRRPTMLFFFLSMPLSLLSRGFDDAASWRIRRRWSAKCLVEQALL